jgi:protein-disulfide isomerase
MEKEIKSSSGSKTNYSTPVAIVLAGLIIAGAMFFSDGKKDVDTGKVKVPAQKVSSLDNVRPVSADDHIRGNPNAPIIIVEYSDTECPFCSRFHNTMKQVVDTYGKNGQVAWVYRHSPLDQLHSKSRKEAVAQECAGELGGNDKFWEYTDRIYAVTPANDGLNVLELPKIAEYIGLDVAKFNTCLASGKYDAKIQADLENAQATGGQGTPWNVVIANGKAVSSINGAYPYDNVKKIIDDLLK